MNFLTDASFDVLLIAPGAVAAAVNRRLVVAVAGVAPHRTLLRESYKTQLKVSS